MEQAQEAKHTPGPWWVTDSGVRDAGGYICHTNKAQHYEGQDERYEAEAAERAANARLIAAAPELLAFAEAFRRDLQERGLRESDLDACQIELLNMADAAIAKASGAPQEKEQGMEVVRCGFLSMQVCVPAATTDDEAERFANAENPTGSETLSWRIRREGDEALQGCPERVPCDKRCGCVHIMLDC